MTTIKKGKLRCGVFGGSFNPPHYGHIQLCNYAREAMLLDKVFLMPTGDNPFKDEKGTTRQNRIDMLKLAAEEIEGCEISRIEIDRTGQSFTVDTMAALNESYDYTFYFICGSDILFQFTKWKNFERLCELTRFICVLRQSVDNTEALNTAEKLNRDYGAKITLLTDYQPEDISSSKIRALTEKGESAKGLLPESVLSYIQKNGLYR